MTPTPTARRRGKVGVLPGTKNSRTVMAGSHALGESAEDREPSSSDLAE